MKAVASSLTGRSCYRVEIPIAHDPILCVLCALRGGPSIATGDERKPTTESTENTEGGKMVMPTVVSFVGSERIASQDLE